MSVSFTIPAYLSNFSALDNGRTVAELKVFYVGETADGRVFDKDFAEKLATTLPYCPVVTFWSDIQDDFVGHNSNQNIYGLVQGDGEYRFEKDDDGREWLITKVLLYTDRTDNIGEIAKKIVGHAQSLELNPNTAKYELFEEDGKRKIRFTDGSLVGLSVLGSSQKPAFTGSEFFMATDFSDLRARFEDFFSCLEENSRGEQMKKEQFEAFANFVKLSYTEKMTKASEKLSVELGNMYYSCIMDMDDTTFLAFTFNYETGKEGYYKYDYALDEVEFTISNQRAVYAKYLTKEEIEYLEGYSNAAVNTEMTAEEEVSEEGAEEAPQEDATSNCTSDATPEVGTFENTDADAEAEQAPVNEDDEDIEISDEDDEENDTTFETTDANTESEKDEVQNEEEENQPELSKEGNEEEGVEFTSNTSTLSDSERIELENYRRRDKIDLIHSFNEILDKEILSKFESDVDAYDYAKLESELSIILSRARRAEQPATSGSVAPMSFGKIANANGDKPVSYKDLVAQRLRK